MCAVALLVSTASGDIDLFLTRGPDDGSVPGMRAPDTFNPAAKDFLASYVPWFGSPERSPFRQDLGRSEIYFLWAEISLRGTESSCQVYGIDLRGSGVRGGAVLEGGLWYRHNKLPPSAYKRWDAANKAPIVGLVAAVTARGIEAPANSGDIATDDGGKTYALLGAIRVSGDSPGAFQLGLGSSTIALRITDPEDPNRFLDYNGSDRRYPFVTLQGKNAYKGPYDVVVVGWWPGDMNCDNAVDFGDINPFVLALSDPDEYRRQYPDCDIANGDINRDGKIDFGDITPFVALLSD
jgi:hypothetical protein